MKILILLLNIILFLNYLPANNIEKILHLIINNEFETAKNIAYKELLETNSDKDKINFLLGYIHFFTNDFSESKRRFELVKNIKQEEVNYFIKIINANEKDNIKSISSTTDSIKNEKFIKYISKLPIRILISESNKNLTVTTNNNMLITVTNNGSQIERFWTNENHPHTITFTNNLLSLNKNKTGTEIELFSSKTGYIVINDEKYRGKISISVNNNNYEIINELDIEDYLKGVLKNEMSPNWHIEALKAQAVAARTFAYYHILQNKNSKFHIGRTWLAQVYSGVKGEHPNAIKAVDATKGIIITHNGKPILAYFHADSGGRTENTKYVWGGELDYIYSRKDRYGSKSDRRFWESKISEKQLVALFNREGFAVRDIRKITPIDKTPSGRYQKLKIHHSGGIFEINSNKFRIMAGSQFLIRSSMFSRIRKSGNEFHFSGKGAGHGVGMPQWSAKDMAESGKNFYDILSYYYRKINFDNI